MRFNHLLQATGPGSTGVEKIEIDVTAVARLSPAGLSPCESLLVCRRCRRHDITRIPHDYVMLDYVLQPLRPGGSGAEGLDIDLKALAALRPSGVERCDVLSICRRCGNLKVETCHSYDHNERVCVVCGAGQPRREELKQW